MSEVNIQVSMMTAVTETLKFKRGNPKVDHEKIMQHISNMAKNVRNQNAKIGMVAAASKTLLILEKEPNLTDKEVMKRVMEELPNILENIRA
jgi:hydroxymethylpyrimidine/phosphomethylpyrimidine kinase